jgi:26S proteasome regulatory subunit N7
MSDEVIVPYPNLEIAQNFFTLSTPSLSQHHEKARAELLAGIEKDEMAPYYKLVASKCGLEEDAALLAKLEEANKKEFETLEERLKAAEESEGETEIGEALRARAHYLARIGEKVGSPATACLGLSLLTLNLRRKPSRPWNSH